jgi:hypothetical protein
MICRLRVGLLMSAVFICGRERPNALRLVGRGVCCAGRRASVAMYPGAMLTAAQAQLSCTRRARLFRDSAVHIYPLPAPLVRQSLSLRDSVGRKKR